MPVHICLRELVDVLFAKALHHAPQHGLESWSILATYEIVLSRESTSRFRF